jgi:hypothetical protein
MSWTVACFCGHLFDGPASRCPRCGTPVPVETVRPHPHRGHLDALIASVRDLEPRSASPLPLGAGRVLDHVLTVRPAAPDDTDAVHRLACLAGRPRPLGHALVGDTDRRPSRPGRRASLPSRETSSGTRRGAHRSTAAHLHADAGASARAALLSDVCAACCQGGPQTRRRRSPGRRSLRPSCRDPVPVGLHGSARVCRPAAPACAAAIESMREIEAHRPTAAALVTLPHLPSVGAGAEGAESAIPAIPCLASRSRSRAARTAAVRRPDEPNRRPPTARRQRR